MAKRLPEPYTPSNPPLEFADWPRWIREEFERVKQDLQANPVIMAVDGSGTVGIDTTLTTITLGIGDTPAIDYPGAQWDSTTGEFTASLDGIYTLTAKATIDAFGPGNKTYFAQLECFVNNALRSESFDGGSDDVPLGVNLTTNLILLAGDVCRIDLSTLHTQFTGSSDYTYSISYLRVAQ